MVKPENRCLEIQSASRGNQNHIGSNPGDSEHGDQQCGFVPADPSPGFKGVGDIMGFQSGEMFFPVHPQVPDLVGNPVENFSPLPQ